MSSARIWIGFACLYAATAVFTFGHAAAHHPVADTVWKDGSHTGNEDITAMGSLCAAAIWPFYWSWELQA